MAYATIHTRVRDVVHDAIDLAATESMVRVDGDGLLDQVERDSRTCSSASAAFRAAYAGDALALMSFSQVIREGRLSVGLDAQSTYVIPEFARAQPLEVLRSRQPEPC